MRVYVTGASGFVGHHVMMHLLECGHDVVALGRRPDAIRTAPGVEIRKLDLLDLDQIVPCIEDCDAGIHAAGAGAESDSRTLHDSNVQASRNLAGACKRKKSLRRLIAFSSAAVLETGDTPYRRAKIGQESAIRSAEIDHTLLRPSLILGPWQESREMETLRSRVRSGHVLLPGGGRQLIQPIHVDDAARAAVSALRRDGSIRTEIVLPGAEGGISHKSFLSLIRQFTGGKARFLSMPLFPLRIAAIGLGIVGQAGPLRAALSFYGRDQLFSLDDSRRLLGHEPRSHAESLEQAFSTQPPETL